MAILALFTGNTSKEQYESLRSEVNWEMEQPKGGIFHAASFDDAGHIHVADVWASRADLDAFVQERLVPAFQKLGFPPPDTAVYEVQNLNAYEAIEQYII